MTTILEAAAAFCLIYYIIIMFYAGAATSFSLFWPLFAIFLFLLVLGLHIYSRMNNRIPVWVPVSAATFCAALAAVFLVTETVMGFSAITSRDKAADYVVVLGAGVRGTEISDSLKRRLDKTLTYTERHPNTVLVLSGGKGPGEDISEARAMYEYLIRHGVPRDRMLIEDQSSDTAENISFSLKVIERREYYKEKAAQDQLRENFRARSEDDPVKISVLSSNFHIYRARAIARKQGVISPGGIAASSNPILFLHLWVREGFAVLKDKFMGRI